MTIENAMNFIQRGLHDGALRKRLNGASSPPERVKILEEEALTFSDAEFDEAYHHLLTQCQEEDQAETIKEFKLYWELLSQGAEGSACRMGCSHCSH